MKILVPLIQNKRVIYGLLWILFLYSLFLKVYFLWYQSFWIDEGFSSHISYNFFQDGIDFKKQQYLIHNISQVISFNISWVSDFSARISSVLFSCINALFIYLISLHLFKDKKQALFASIIFSFLTWEIIWARQARFYALLQLIFSINIYLIIKIINDFKIKYFNIALISLYIWVLFHPFLWSNVVLFILWIIYLLILQKKNLRKRVLFNKKSISIYLIIIFIIWIEATKYFLQEKWVSIPWASTKLPQDSIESYIQKYSYHLSSQLGILHMFSFIWMFIIAYKRKILESIILSFWYIFIFYIISQKGFLFHTRYVLILYPLIIILSSYSIFYFHSLIKRNIFKHTYTIIIWLLILFTAKFTFFPQKEYAIDYTSPQPSFKQAYNIIPNEAQVISWFPMMCEWYFWQKWECIYHLPVDYVWSPESIQNTLNRWKDNYTSLLYLLSLNQLEKSKKYYFVFDALSLSRTINKDILKEVLQNWEIIFNQWKTYNNIKVIKYIMK